MVNHRSNCYQIETRYTKELKKLFQKRPSKTRNGNVPFQKYALSFLQNYFNIITTFMLLSRSLPGVVYGREILAE